MDALHPALVSAIVRQRTKTLMHNSATAARIAVNEVRFRAANDRIGRAATLRHFDGQRVPFLCECAKLDCTQVVLLDLETYGEIRDNPRWFFAVPGHETDGVAAGAEIVVEERDGVTVLEKIGIGAEIAEQSAPGLTAEARNPSAVSQPD